MSSTSTSTAERISETLAYASANMALQLLTELVNEPSTKRFLKSRGTRLARWAQLERTAREQINGLSALAKAPTARKTRPKPVAPAAAPERDQGPPLPFEAAVS